MRFRKAKHEGVKSVIEYHDEFVRKGKRKAWAAGALTLAACVGAGYGIAEVGDQSALTAAYSDLSGANNDLAHAVKSYEDVTTAECDELLTPYDKLSNPKEAFAQDYIVLFTDGTETCGLPAEASESHELHFAVKGAQAEVIRYAEDLAEQKEDSSSTADELGWFAVAGVVMGGAIADKIRTNYIYL